MERQKQEATLIVDRSVDEEASETVASALHKLIMDAINCTNSETEDCN